MRQLIEKSQQKKWLVFYTKSRQEKAVQEYLTKRGYEVFLPLQKVMRQWSDRKKKVEVPLFNSYIFVNEKEDSIPTLLQAPGMAWNIRYNDKPAVIRQKELETIHRFLSSGLLLETGPLENLQPGDPVEVIDGPLKGFRGSLARTEKGDQFTVELESIRQSLKVSLPATLLKRI